MGIMMTSLNLLCEHLNQKYSWLSQISFSISSNEITIYSVNDVMALDLLSRTKNDRYLSLIVAKDIKQSQLVELETEILYYLSDECIKANEYILIEKNSEEKFEYKKTNLLELIGLLSIRGIEIF